MKSVLSREGMYYLFIVFVVLIGAIIREINPMLLFAAFLCAPLIIAWRLGRRSIRDLKVRRRLPLQIFAGDPFVVHLEMANPRPKRRRFSVSSWGVIVQDRIRPKMADKGQKPYEPAVYFEYVPNEQARRKTYAGRLPRRGPYEIGSMTVSTRFPFGFFRHWFVQPTAENESSEFVVYPKLGKLTAQWKMHQHEAIEAQRRHRFRPSRVSGEFLGVRRWQQGDSRKWIHWRASARHQVPVVRQFEQHRNRDVAVLIDLYQDGPMTETQRENFELAVSFTATLVTETNRQGSCNFYFSTSGVKDDYVIGPVCMAITEGVLLRLALAEPEQEDALVDNLIRAAGLTDPGSELILVTPRPFEPDSERFRDVQKDARFRSVLKRLRVIDTSDPELEKIFCF